MKKMINGKRYDTETARYIGSCSSDYSVTNPRYFEESLYLKRTGEFFFFFLGGGMSRYATGVSGSMTGNEKIIPISSEEARRWGKKHLEVEKYEEVFELEKEENVLFSVLLPKSIYEELKNEAAGENVSMKEVVVKRLKQKIYFVI